jgi:hypothetical protein
VHGFDGIHTLAFPELESVGASLWVAAGGAQANSQMTSVSFPKLVNVSGYVVVTSAQSHG